MKALSISTYLGLIVRLGAIPALVIRGEVEGVDDALLVSAEPALHYEGVLLAPHEVEVRGDVTVDIPGLTKLSQTWDCYVTSSVI